MSYYVREDEILGESRFRRKPFVKSGNAFLPMQRPHFDADALIGKMTRRGIRMLRKAAVNRSFKAFRPKSA